VQTIRPLRLNPPSGIEVDSAIRIQQNQVRIIQKSTENLHTYSYSKLSEYRQNGSLGFLGSREEAWEVASGLTVVASWECKLGRAVERLVLVC
jgi:hypothetical protein